jgi:hypothetical protein
MPRRAHSAFHPCESSTQPSSRNEVILTGCVGDKLILGVLSLGRPSVPWVTHQVLSPVVGDLSPVGRFAEYTGIQILEASKILSLFLVNILTRLRGVPRIARECCGNVNVRVHGTGLSGTRRGLSWSRNWDRFFAVGVGGGHRWWLPIGMDSAAYDRVDGGFCVESGNCKGWFDVTSWSVCGSVAREPGQVG